MKISFKSVLVITSISTLLFFTGCSNNPDDSNDSSKASASSFEPVSISDKTYTASVTDGFVKSTSSFEYSFTYNPEDFISGDNTEYSTEKSKFLAALAVDVYDSVSVNITGDSVAADNNTAIYEALGFKDIKFYELQSSDFSQDSYDISKIMLSHQEYTLDNVNYSIVIAAIQGTNGTYEQWTSNFDIGDDSTSYTDKTGTHPEWTNKHNHKGFDVAANRINAIVEEYLGSFPTDIKTIILFTGHSRGAAIANILGAKYETEGKYKTYTYTYATPSVTDDSETAGKIKTVFNIINSDDLIPVMPLSSWGFVRNGTSISASVNDNYSSEWSTLISGKKYCSGKAQAAIADGGFLSGVIDSRSEIYVISESENNKYTYEYTTNPEQTLKDYDFTAFYNLTFTDPAAEGEKGTVDGYICPEFLLHYMASIIALTSNTEKFTAFTKAIKSAGFSTKYRNFVNGFVQNISGLTYSHAPVSYLLLCNKEIQ